MKRDRKGKIRYIAGADIGSTTAKFVIMSRDMKMIYNDYSRHLGDIPKALKGMLKKAMKKMGNIDISLAVTGSAGMGVAERMDIPFVQEVVAAADYIKHFHPGVKTLIDIGGEDSKIIFFDERGRPDMRMNGNCAGGTGAFIDQMATLLDVDISELDGLAGKATEVYTIASRCGVFAKTDVQNLLSRKISKENIAASIFHAVVVQTVSTLARGFDPKPKVVFCGGPTTFLSMLKKDFIEFLEFRADDCVDVSHPLLLPAIGTAIYDQDERLNIGLRSLIQRFETHNDSDIKVKGRLDPLFSNKKEYQTWEKGRMKEIGQTVELLNIKGKDCFLGIDSGSTTTKIVLTDDKGNLAYKFYSSNRGDPIGTVVKGLEELKDLLINGNIHINVAKACVTGYGEDLIKAAFSADLGIVETLGHFRAASEMIKDVSFILDIGGQDMKAIFIDGGVITNIEINEACSSGCGSFIETFARSMGYQVEKFAKKGVHSKAPADLGTRCTVFMNSKVKQSFREGATVEDISAGLAFSVIKNCFYKVLKIKDTSVLGENIVVQGGTFRNPGVHRAMELLLGREVICSTIPELMGAYGAALKAKDIWQEEISKEKTAKTSTFIGLDNLDIAKNSKSRLIKCKGCENRCSITKLTFDSNKVFYTGNKCERYFTNKGTKHQRGKNLLGYKLDLLFSELDKTESNKKGSERSRSSGKKNRVRIGIPRVLNLFDNLPFWQRLFEDSGLDVVLSPPSNKDIQEMGARTVMSENICFPAKLTNGHILSLGKMKVDRIFYPMVVFERMEYGNSLNEFNCPIVSGYPDVIKNAVIPQRRFGIPFDAPTINFGDDKLLKKACWKYLKTIGVKKGKFNKAFISALEAQNKFREDTRAHGKKILKKAKKDNRLVVILLGRPYHLDQVINQKVPEIITDLGADVISEDSIPHDIRNGLKNVNVLTQWSYPNRIFAAANWAARQKNVEVVQLNSFGCGPDAVVCDEVKRILEKSGKVHTVIRIDEVSSPGSIKLRLRSMMESLYQRKFVKSNLIREMPENAIFEDKDAKKKIIIPYFSPFHSPPLESALNRLGYDFETLPPPDRKSVDAGQKFTNNEICYPATIVIGDIIKALQSGKYDLDKTAVGISQTGGQCRASSYLPLLNKALISAGFAHVPSVTVHFSNEKLNYQPGFKPDKKKLSRLGLPGLLLSDSIMQFYNATVVREKNKGDTWIQTEIMIDKMVDFFGGRSKQTAKGLLREAVQRFNGIDTYKGEYPAVGFVGEIYVKFNPFANFYMVEWLQNKGIEVVVPPITDFFTQGMINTRASKDRDTKRGGFGYYMSYVAQWYVNYYHNKFEKIKKKFKFYRRTHTIGEIAEKASRTVSLTNQFGEGWLIPGEIAAFAEDNVNNVICVQPFGCIANHIIGKGVEKRMRELYPDLNLLYLDCDMGSSEVNVFNRLNFLIKSARDSLKAAKA